MLREDSKGRINVVGVAEEPVGSAEELLATLTRGKKRRATHATDVNAGSSRSHAVMRLTVHLAAPMQQAATSEVPQLSMTLPLFVAAITRTSGAFHTSWGKSEREPMVLTSS